MQIKRCYPLPIRTSAWGAYDGLDFNNGETFDDAMHEAYKYYCIAMHHDGTTAPAHVTVKYGDNNGTYKINADGSYKKISDEFLTLEQICELSRKNTVHKGEEYARCV
jgi:hypothetical protein